MTDHDLKILLSELRSFPNETEWIEFKLNNAIKIGEYISALSNSACIQDKPYGYIVFGIDDKTHRIIGTKFKPNQKAKGNEDLIPWLARLLEPRINFEFYEISIEGVRVVIIKIQATQNTPIKFQGTSYKRIGSYKKKLEEYPEKQRQIWTKTPAIVFEKEFAATSLNSDEILKLLNYTSYFDLANLTLPDNRAAIFDKLLQEQIIVKQGEKYSITNLGATLFAKRLDAFENLDRKAIRVIIYEGKNKLKTKKEQLGQKGYASGFKGLVGWINDQLPTNEEIGRAF